jgi:hypothetical protein
MSISIIPFFDFSAFTQEISLDNVPYMLSFTWNNRGEFWAMSISDKEQNTLVAGIKLVIGIELLRKFPDRSLPPGRMFVFDVKEDESPIAYTDFINDRGALVYEAVA